MEDSAFPAEITRTLGSNRSSIGQFYFLDVSEESCFRYRMRALEVASTTKSLLTAPASEPSFAFV